MKNIYPVTIHALFNGKEISRYQSLKELITNFALPRTPYQIRGNGKLLDAGKLLKYIESMRANKELQELWELEDKNPPWFGHGHAKK